MGKGNDLSQTQRFVELDKLAKNKTKETITLVYSALKEKGYNPINQIVGYILSGDPTYITSHQNARSIISKLERDEILEEILEFYINGSI